MFVYSVQRVQLVLPLPALILVLPSGAFVHERRRNIEVPVIFPLAILLLNNMPRHPAFIPLFVFCHSLRWISLLCGVRESFKLFSSWQFALWPAFIFMMGLRGDGSLKGGRSRYTHGERESWRECWMFYLQAICLFRREMWDGFLGSGLAGSCVYNASWLLWESTNMKADSHAFIMAHMLYEI